MLLGMSLLVACTITPPSRSYDNQIRNIQIIDSNALNIDAIKPITNIIEANKIWQNSGVFIEQGDSVTIKASGSWSPAPAMLAWSGPEGNALWAVEVTNITGGALMAKLGHDGHPFEIGLLQTFKAKDYGMLYFAMNDPFRYLYDNQGKITAEIYAINAHTDSASSASTINILAYRYNDKTQQGSLTASINKNAFVTRQYLLNKIGEIASSKHIAIKAGDAPLKGGVYEVLGESINNGQLEIKFKTLW